MWEIAGVKFDNTLTYEKHITDVCRKVIEKLMH